MTVGVGAVRALWRQCFLPQQVDCRRCSWLWFHLVLFGAPSQRLSLQPDSACCIQQLCHAAPANCGLGATTLAAAAAADPVAATHVPDSRAQGCVSRPGLCSSNCVSAKGSEDSSLLKISISLQTCQHVAEAETASSSWQEQAVCLWVWQIRARRFQPRCCAKAVPQRSLPRPGHRSAAPLYVYVGLAARLIDILGPTQSPAGQQILLWHQQRPACARGAMTSKNKSGHQAGGRLL